MPLRDGATEQGQGQSKEPQGQSGDPDRPFETTQPAGERDSPASEKVAVEEAAEAEARALTRDRPELGKPGPPLNRRSPYIVGMFGAAGVATTYILLELVLRAGNVLLLIVLALFLAIGLDPAVQWLIRRGLPRWAAVTLVSLVIVGAVLGFVAAAIPPLAAQTTQLVKELPTYWKQLNNHSSTLGRLEAHYHLRERVSQLFTAAGGAKLFGGLLGAGMIVVDAFVSAFTVLVLTIYLLADMPRIRRLIYRLVPRTRRPRAILLGDEIFGKVGGYVLGNLITSAIIGVGTFVWLAIWHIPYPLLLSIMVALFDLIPVIGSPLAGLIVTLVALTISFPVALFTGIFYAGYKLTEDYVLVPRIMGRAVEVPATATVVAVLIGGTALGLVGALVAIPVAAGIRLLLREVVYPRLDRT
ncbi:AI-2E family transporter [Planosporangium thailandense]|uniref:AI-2E family transporter n=1 Tax=Planosporangium thailandense TaxID=765197 RepID=UPI00197BCE0C